MPEILFQDLVGYKLFEMEMVRTSGKLVGQRRKRPTSGFNEALWKPMISSVDRGKACWN